MFNQITALYSQTSAILFLGIKECKSRNNLVYTICTERDIIPDTICRKMLVTL